MLELGSGFDMDLSGKENIFLNGAILGYSKEFLESKYDEILAFSELGDFIYSPIRNYSSGMLMRLAFSIATVVEPEILIVDEILAVGDENFQKKSKQRIDGADERRHDGALCVSQHVSDPGNVRQGGLAGGRYGENVRPDGRGVRRL